MKRCGYCKWFRKFANKNEYGICAINKCGYSDGGTFSTNTCCYFEHWHTSNKQINQTDLIGGPKLTQGDYPGGVLPPIPDDF